MRAALDLRDRPVVFGLDMFQRPTTLFEANLAGPVDEDYRLGPGDQLVLILTGDVEQAHTLDVTREGTIVIPQVGQIAVNNLTLSELNELLYARLGRVYSGVVRGPNARTRFSVSVAKLRSNQVFVTGDVSQPGSYRVSSAGTALTALYAAGGPTANGSMRRVTVRRGSRAADTLDVYDYLLKGEASHDGRLQAGDIVFIPVHGPRVQLTGKSCARPCTSWCLAKPSPMRCAWRGAFHRTLLGDACKWSALPRPRSAPPGAAIATCWTSPPVQPMVTHRRPCRWKRGT